MVSAIIALVFLVVIIIAVAYFVSLGNSLIDLTQEFQEVFFTQIELREVIPIPSATEDVCDIRVSVNAELTATGGILPIQALFVKVDGNSVRYTWFDCHPSTLFPAFSLIDLGKTSSVGDPLAFILFEDPIVVEVELKNFPGDPPVIVNKFLRPNLSKTFQIPTGDVPLPFPISAEFIITNIPDRNYKLFLSFPTREINNLSTGEPFIFNVCKQFTVTC